MNLVRLKPKIIDRYIFKEAAQFFGVTLLTFISVLLTLRMLKFAALIINKGVETSQILNLFLAIIPPFLEIAIPLSALLGVMLAFSRLSGDSEIIIMRASGIGILRLALPVAIFGLIALSTNLVVSIYLRPWGFARLSEVLFDIARSRTTSGLSPGVFNKLQDLTLYAEDINPSTGTLKNILIDDRRSEDTRKVFIARRGLISSDAQSETITFALSQGTIHEAMGEKYGVTSFDANILVFAPNELLDKNAEKKGKRTEEMGLAELGRESKKYREVKRAYDAGDLAFGPQPKEGETALPNGELITIKELKKKINRLRLEFARRLSLPFAPLALAIIGIPLGIHSPRTQRTWGAHLSVIFGLGVFVVYYGILSVGMALSESGNLSPWLALWLPNLATSALGLFMLLRISLEKWQTIADAFSMTRLKSFLSRLRLGAQ